MKKLISRTLILAMVLGFGAAAFATAQDDTWTGVMTETHCAAAGAKAPADCAANCKEKGAHWALYNAADKSTFLLSGDDAMMLKMNAKEVTIKGKMDKQKKMIKVTSMEPMPAKKM